MKSKVKNNLEEENKAHIARWKEQGVGTIAEINRAMKACPPEDIEKVCNRETCRHTVRKCKELLDTIKQPIEQKEKEEELKREIIDMLICERLVYTDGGDGSGPERSPVSVVKQFGLPSDVVDSIVNNPGWDHWFNTSPV